MGHLHDQNVRLSQRMSGGMCNDAEFLLQNAKIVFICGYFHLTSNFEIDFIYAFASCVLMVLLFF